MSVKQTNLVGVSVKEVCAWQRCPPCLLYWVIHLTGVSTFKGFLAYRYTVFAPGKGVNITGVSTIQICGCLSNRIVQLTEMSTFQIDLYIWQERPFLKGGWNTVVHLTGCEPFRGVISVMCTWLQGCLSCRVVPLGRCECGRDVHLAGVFDKPDARVHLRRLFTL